MSNIEALNNIDKLSYPTLNIYCSLAENIETHVSNNDGTAWGVVYLAYVRPRLINAKASENTLSKLAEHGLYIPIGTDNSCGLVLIGITEIQDANSR